MHGIDYYYRIYHIFHKDNKYEGDLKVIMMRFDLTYLASFLPGPQRVALSRSFGRGRASTGSRWAGRELERL